MHFLPVDINSNGRIRQLRSGRDDTLFQPGKQTYNIDTLSIQFNECNNAT